MRAPLSFSISLSVAYIHSSFLWLFMRQHPHEIRHCHRLLLISELMQRHCFKSLLFLACQTRHFKGFPSAHACRLLFLTCTSSSLSYRFSFLSRFLRLGKSRQLLVLFLHLLLSNYVSLNCRLLRPADNLESSRKRFPYLYECVGSARM